VPLRVASVLCCAVLCCAVLCVLCAVCCARRPLGVLLDNVAQGWTYSIITWNDVAGKGAGGSTSVGTPTPTCMHACMHAWSLCNVQPARMWQFISSCVLWSTLLLSCKDPPMVQQTTPAAVVCCTVQYLCWLYVEAGDPSPAIWLRLSDTTRTTPQTNCRGHRTAPNMTGS